MDRVPLGAKSLERRGNFREIIARKGEEYRGCSGQLENILGEI